jgi:hypothetical protein
MKKRLFISLIIITVFFSIIIITGCGGGKDNIITPPSIFNQNPTNNTVTDGAYINIRVKWPQEGSHGNIIMSSDSEENTLTASMPNGVTKIIVKVRPAPDPNDPNAPPDDPSIYFEHGYHEITAPPDYAIIDSTVTFGHLPAVKVIVRSETYDIRGLLAIAEKEFQLYVEPDNEVTLDLGYTNIYVKVAPIFRRYSRRRT